MFSRTAFRFCASAKESVLILCTGNSCRSHMAEGIINKFAGDRYQAVSAGTRPTGYVHPLAIKALNEIGADISHNTSKHTDDVKLEDGYDVAITVCDNALRDKPDWLKDSVHIGFDDPADATGSEEDQLKVFRKIRDEIQQKVVNYLTLRQQRRSIHTEAKAFATTFDSVQDYYGKVLSTNKDLKTTACTAFDRPHPIIIDAIKKIPDSVTEKFYGCGTPLPLGINGLTVLDLGSGSGRDAYVASQLVGENGKVIGIDMTDEQLSVAREASEAFTQSLGYKECNMEFKKGYIEYLDKASIDNESIDLVISNCVQNLSPDKPRVISEAYRVLKNGGEFHFSDVYCDRRLPEKVTSNEVLWGECIAGAMYIEDFIRESQAAGFDDPRVLAATEIIVQDPELKEICGEAKFYSITYRLFKLPGMLETKCEDYGQFAVYKGTIPGYPNSFTLDDHHKLETNKPFLVCGNTAAMLGENGVSWLSPHFEIHGDRSTHFGLFDCGPSPVTAPAPSASAGGACC
eukprot:TRINITY_DN1482_c1_g1_i1.p1 TRINITY_DN1482_c1_g1~~TRINITY_DN1482_c1_g1_i1.p1  ORF type:complete len:516 (+),score=99.79 TRINITY_DN1482_c1_g1_i1:69-1616(+)